MKNEMKDVFCPYCDKSFWMPTDPNWGLPSNAWIVKDENAQPAKRITRQQIQEAVRKMFNESDGFTVEGVTEFLLKELGLV